MIERPPSSAKNHDRDRSEPSFWRSLDVPKAGEWVAAARSSPILARILFRATLNRSQLDTENPGDWVGDFLRQPAWDRIAARLRHDASIESNRDSGPYVEWAGLAASLAALSHWCRSEDAFWLTLASRPEDDAAPSAAPALLSLRALPGPQRCRLITGWLLAWRAEEMKEDRARGNHGGPFPSLPENLAFDRFLEVLAWIEPEVDWPALLAEIPPLDSRDRADPFHEHRPLLMAWATSAHLTEKMLDQGSGIGAESIGADDSIVAAARRLTEIESRFHSAIGEFAAGAGHEINNPLGAILGQAQWLLQDESDPRRRHALEKITDQVARVRRMIRDLRLIGRPSGPRRAAVSLAECLAKGAAGAGAGAGAGKSGGGASLTIEPIPPVVIHGCAEEMARLFEEIIRNALEAAGANGHVSVTVDCPDDRRTRVTVTDSGPGFSAEARRHAFTPFHSGRSAGRGLGMGLSVARRIALDHGGQLHLGMGRPTCVRITLPIEAAAIQRAAA